LLAVTAGAAVPADSEAARATLSRPTQTLAGWDPAEQQTVLSFKVMKRAGDGRFHGERPMTRSEFKTAAERVAQLIGVKPVPANGATRVSIRDFDAWAVTQLGLAPTAAVVQSSVAKAGLRPPRRLGTEVLARFLKLRFNHPFPSGEKLEPFPTTAVTRAEAAWTFAQMLSIGNSAVQEAWRTYSNFKLPPIPPNRVGALRIAVSKVGMPYIWGGHADTAAQSGGAQTRGGYDCSGFSWRVFKLSGLSTGRQIKGRTADQQAGEIPRAKRVPLSKVRAGDLVFFGTARFDSTPTYSNVSHMGIALSSTWSIESTGRFAGVGIRLIRKRAKDSSFAWARRLR
jgi:cell wall-associated NlpC family hydrolase